MVPLSSWTRSRVSRLVSLTSVMLVLVTLTLLPLMMSSDSEILWISSEMSRVTYPRQLPL